MIRRTCKSSLAKVRAKWHKSCRLKFAQAKIDRVKARKCKFDENVADTSTTKTRKSTRTVGSAMDESMCIFCDGTEGNLHEGATWGLDGSLKDMATSLHDTVVLAKQCTGDIIANEIKYHLHCLTSFRNRYR